MPVQKILAAFIRRHPVKVILFPVLLAAGLAGVWLGDPWGRSLPGEAPEVPCPNTSRCRKRSCARRRT